VNARFLSQSALTNTVALNKLATVQLVQPAPTAVIAASNQVTAIQPSLAAIATTKRSRIMPTLQPAVTARLEQVRWINPKLGISLGDLRPAVEAEGVPRSQITVPVSLSAAVSDEQLFEDPTNANQKFYLPRYRIVERNRQVQMSLAANARGWALTIYLEQYPAPALSTLAREAQAIQHEVSVLLQHRLSVGDVNGGLKEWIFAPPVPDTGNLRAVLQVSTQAELSLLYQVLTTPEYGAMVTVRRTIKVGIPASTSPSNKMLVARRQNMMRLAPMLRAVSGASAADILVSSGESILRGTWTFNLDIGVLGGDGSDLWWEQQTDTIRSMVPSGRAILAYLGTVDFESLSVEQLQQLPYSTTPINGSIDAPQNNLLMNGSVFAVLTNGGNYAKVQVVAYGYDLAIRWITYRPHVSSDPLFREATRVLDHRLDPQPFVFPQALYSYIYQGATGMGNQTFKPRRWSFVWQGKAYSYYQDPVQPQVIYYLPDCFKLVRRRESPHYPMISIYFSAANDSDQEVLVTVEYWAFPFVDTARLNAAAQELNSAGVAGRLVFQPLIAGKPRLFLKLPQADGSVRRQECVDVAVELRTGFSDSLTMSLKAFQAIFEALFSTVTQVFQGEVQVDFPDEPSEILPFRAQIGDLVGEVLDYAQTVDPASNSVQVTLKNGIESPIRLSSLVSQFKDGEIQVAGILSNVIPSVPVDLPPEATLSCTITPAQAIAPTSFSNLLFDVSSIKVLPDREAIWNALLRPDSPASYQRLITVKVRKAVFGDRITDISIDFKLGGTINISYEEFGERGSDQLTISAAVFSPISNLILRKAESGLYEFRATVLLKDGRKVQDPPNQWRTDMAETLLLTTDELPPLAPG